MLFILKTNFLLAMRNLAVNKLRSLLTLLGMIIGVGAVIGIVSAGEGLKASFVSEIQSWGSGVMLYVAPKGVIQMGAQYMPEKAEPFKMVDVVKLREEAQSLSLVFPSNFTSGKAKYKQKTYSVNIDGEIPLFFNAPFIKFEKGRGFNEREYNAVSRVAVIGAKVRKEIFPSFVEPLGQTFKLNNENFTVIGVLKEKGGSNTGIPVDDTVYIPLTTLNQRFTGNDEINFIVAVAKDVTKVESAKEEIKKILRKSRKITDPSKDNFEIYTAQDFIDFVKQFMNAMVLAFAFIAVFSLLVGSIGIMNIMLVSVVERTREIGLRMSVGASRSRILSQFLSEAILLTVIGAIIGVGFGFAIGFGVSIWLSRLLNVSFTARIPFGILLVTLVVSVGIGVVSGIYPAYLACQKDPIRSLRYE